MVLPLGPPPGGERRGAYFQKSVAIKIHNGELQQFPSEAATDYYSYLSSFISYKCWTTKLSYAEEYCKQVECQIYIGEMPENLIIPGLGSLLFHIQRIRW